MSLTETDKNSDNRSKPTLNVQDTMPPESVMAHATTGVAYRAEGTTTAAKVIQKDDQIILFDGTANKILIGRDGSGAYKVKIAQDGVNVLSATDAQLLFDGDRNTLRVIGSVRTTTIAQATYAAGTSTDDTVTVSLTSLGLTSTPLILAFYTTGGSTAGLGSNPFGGNRIDFIDASTPANIRAFTVLSTSHTSTQASFTRRFINCSAGENLTTPQYNIAFIVCTQTAA